MHSVFLDAVAPKHLKKGELNSSSVGSFSLSTWVTKPHTRFVLERTTHCSLLCSHLFGRGFKQTIHIMLNTGQTLKSSISLCPVVLVLSFFFLFISEYQVWWLRHVVTLLGRWFLCLFHTLSPFIQFHIYLFRDTEAKGQKNSRQAIYQQQQLHPMDLLHSQQHRFVLFGYSLSWSCQIRHWQSLLLPLILKYNSCELLQCNLQYNKEGIKTTLIIRKTTVPYTWWGSMSHCLLDEFKH